MNDAEILPEEFDYLPHKQSDDQGQLLPIKLKPKPDELLKRLPFNLFTI